MADDKQTTTDLVNKVVESFGLLHNDLEEVKNILVKNGIQSNGTTAQLASEVTKLPEKTEETIKKSGEVKGLANGTLDITGGFSYSPTTANTLNSTTCLINIKAKDFSLPKEKELEMYFPSDELAANVMMSETSKDKRNINLEVNSKLFLQQSYIYLTGCKLIDKINLTVNIKDTSIQKVDYAGKKYVNFPLEGRNDRPGQPTQFEGRIGFADYNTKFTVNDELLEYVKCEEFVLTPNKYVKEVVCDRLKLDLYALQNILYKYSEVYNRYYSNYGKEETYDPILIKLTTPITNMDYISKSGGYAYITPEFVNTNEPIKDDGSYGNNNGDLFTSERAKDIIGLSVNAAKLLSKMCHILVDPDKIDLSSYDALILRLPFYNLDNTKKYNYSTRKWEDIAKATDDTEMYFNIAPASEEFFERGKLIGYDKFSRLHKVIDRNPRIQNIGMVTLDDYDDNNIISVKNTFFTKTNDMVYRFKSGELVNLNVRDVLEQNNTFIFDSMGNVGTTYPLDTIHLGRDKNLTVKFGDDLGALAEYANIITYIRLLPTDARVKYKTHDNLDITKLDMHFYSEGCPLFFNKSITEVKVAKIIIPYRAKSFRDIVFDNSIFEEGFTKFIFEDSGVEIAQEIPASLRYYKNQSEFDMEVGDYGKIYNHPGYRFDCTQQDAIDNFIKHVHCHIRSNNPVLQNKNFLKYRLPLFTLDGNQRFNYSLRQWQLINQYNSKNDNKPMVEIFPELADELNAMRVIGSR